MIPSLRVCFGCACVVLLVLGGQGARAASSVSPGVDTSDVVAAAPGDSTSPASADAAVSAPVDTAGVHPNAVPYRTDRSLGYHLLAAPSYVLQGVTWPLGWTFRYVERTFPDLFEPRAPIRGVLPLIELGGPVGIQGGLALFHHDFLGLGHDVRLGGIYGARNYYEIELNYEIPSVLGDQTALDIESNFFTNPEDRFFRLGNDSDFERDETRHYIQQFDVHSRLRYQIAPRLTGFSLLRYENVETRPADGLLGDRFPRSLPGLGTLNLMTVHTQLALDWTRGTRVGGPLREYAGTKVIAETAYQHDLNSDRFRTLWFAGEIQQYLPVLVFPETRRIALRARVEKVDPVFEGTDVPFYHLPGLGGQQTLRGFVYDRFVDDGFLLLNAEYRYPIWAGLDAVWFVDAGQVFTRFDDIAADRFRWSYGGGLHALSGSGLAFRFEVAGSTDGLRTVLTVTPAFD